MQRVVPGLPGLRLQLDACGRGALIDPSHWSVDPPPQAPRQPMALLQRYGLVQHGLSLPRLLGERGLAVEQLEVIYSPFFEALLAWPQVPQLITCHDLTPLVLPNSRKAWLRYRFWQPRHLRCATRVLAISRYVADQLLGFGVPAERIAVVPNGIEVLRERITTPASEDLLVLARHDANKNLPALLGALAGVQRRLPDWRGVVRIVGRSGRQSPLLQRLVRQLPRPEQVHWIPSLEPQQLLQHLRQSLALISASLEEGFDYPVLEAKAEGLPTLISDIPVHREFHQGSALFFPPADDGSVLAAQLQQLRQDQRAWHQLSEAGYLLAQEMSVIRQVDQIAALIAAVASS
ncbi:glycosyltransferase [Synechococcus sp. CBW1108]|nr:glycosyltransferase [Synechococcus sp. CBW1108]